jgi:hypothetical protein
MVPLKIKTKEISLQGIASCAKCRLSSFERGGP